MPASKRLFISDVHLGTDSPKNWFQPGKHGAALIAFLEHVIERKAEIKDLVLLGDFFDLWVARVDVVPPTIDEILANPKNAPILQKLRECADSIENVFFVNGNHDMQVTPADVAKVRGTRRALQWIPRYQGGLLYGEHGSRFAMFNAPDKLHDPTDGLPLGYFITRILSTTDKEYDSPAAVFGYVDDLLEAAFTTQKLASSVIEAISELSGLTPETAIKMPNGRRDVTIAEVQAKYAGLYDRWVEKFGQRYSLHAIQAEMKSLGWFADRLCESNGFRTVVLGHTHDAEVDVDALFVSNKRVYVNSGSWCIDQPTFVEVDKTAAGFTVSVSRWSAGGFSVTGGPVTIAR